MRGQREKCARQGIQRGRSTDLVGSCLDMREAIEVRDLANKKCRFRRPDDDQYPPRRPIASIFDRRRKRRSVLSEVAWIRRDKKGLCERKRHGYVSQDTNAASQSIGNTVFGSVKQVRCDRGFVYRRRTPPKQGYSILFRFNEDEIQAGFQKLPFGSRKSTAPFSAFGRASELRSLCRRMSCDRCGYVRRRLIYASTYRGARIEKNGCSFFVMIDFSGRSGSISPISTSFFGDWPS